MNLLLATANMLGGFLGAYMVQNFGRRFNLRYGCLINIIAMYTLGLSIYMEITVLQAISVIVFMLSYAVGIGGTTTLYTSEIISSSGVGIATAMQWLISALVGKYTNDIAIE